MTKANPFTDLRPEMPSVGPRTFIDPAQPAKEWPIAGLRALDDAETSLAVDTARALYRAYVGDPENGEPPSTYMPDIGGKPIALSESRFLNVVILCQMQTATSEDERYTFEQMYGLSVTRPTAWREIVKWSNEVARGGKGKNSSGADTAQ